jgi:hypothetical protein
MFTSSSIFLYEFRMLFILQAPHMLHWKIRSQPKQEVMISLLKCRNIDDSKMGSQTVLLLREKETFEFDQAVMYVYSSMLHDCLFFYASWLFPDN